MHGTSNHHEIDIDIDRRGAPWLNRRDTVNGIHRIPGLRPYQALRACFQPAAGLRPFLLRNVVFPSHYFCDAMAIEKGRMQRIHHGVNFETQKSTRTYYYLLKELAPL